MYVFCTENEYIVFTKSPFNYMYPTCIFKYFSDINHIIMYLKNINISNI